LKRAADRLGKEMSELFALRPEREQRGRAEKLGRPIGRAVVE
jgi:hypothetical protein